MIMPCSVLIVQDQPVVRQALGLLLENSIGIAVAGSTGDHETALEIAAEQSPDVAFIDLDHFTLRADDLVRDLKGQDDALGVLLFCDGQMPALLKRCIDSGANGCVCKSRGFAQLLEGIARVASGETYHDPRLLSAVEKFGLSDRERIITARQAEILALLAKGTTGVEAAKQLRISPETVRTHVRNAMTKLGANTRAHAIVLAILRDQIEVND